MVYNRSIKTVLNFKTRGTCMKIAIVTGASNGMGREFAKILDRENLEEIWGIGLEEENLKQLADELATPFRAFAVDLTNGGVDQVVEQLQQGNHDVHWLVNSAGFGKFGRYDEIPVEQSTNMVRLNCECLVEMTERVLPFMSAGARIAQFSSVAAFQPTPYQNVYAATKAFVHSYSRALNVELKPRKITCTAVCPYWTKTAFFDRAEQQNNVVTNMVVLYDPKAVVEKAYKDIKRGKDFSMYGFVARSQTRLVKFLPIKMVMNTWVKQQKFDKRYK